MDETNSNNVHETMPQWHIDLQEKGYAIIPGVLDPEECAILENGFWNFWKRLSGGRLQRDKPKTWRRMFDFFPLHGMLCQHFSIGHMQEIWNVRSHERVKKVFETIWGTDDLVTSFDGAATCLAPEVTREGWHRKDWLHLDQAPSRNDLECVQAWVTAEDVGPGDATLTVLEGSHELHAKFSKHFGMEHYKSDWLKLKTDQEAWYRAQGCTQIAVECPKGSMVVWDSRTVHAGRGPLEGRSTRHNRFVAYVCMLPSSHLKHGERKLKQRACLEGRLTSHWPAGRVRLFDKNPRTYGHQLLPDIPAYEPPHFTQEQARLAGWLNPEECPLTLENREDQLRAIELALKDMGVNNNPSDPKPKVNGGKPNGKEKPATPGKANAKRKNRRGKKALPQ